MVVKKVEESQRESDSSEDDSDSNSTNGYVEKEVLVEYLKEFRGLEMKTTKKSMIRMASSTEKLDHILGVGKSPCERSQI